MNSWYYGNNNGNYPYYGAPAPQPKPPLFTRLRRSPEYAPFRELFVTACILGCAFLAYPAMSDLFSLVLTSVPSLFRKYSEDVSFAYLFEAVFSVVCVGLPFFLVYLMLRSSGRYKGDIPLRAPASGSAAFLLIFAGLGLCFAGDVATGWLTAFLRSIGVDFYSYQKAVAGEPMPDGFYGFYAFLLRTAVVPAFIEEFAFRGVVLQSLRRYGDWFAVVVSAVLFGFMHGNMTQMPFALIAGLALGYAFIVTGSLWTSVIIHFFNNFVAVLFTAVSSAYGEGAAAVFSVAATYGFVALGLLAGGIYCAKNPRFYRLYPSVYPGQKKKAIAFFAAPTIIIAVLIFIKYMLDDVMIRGGVS